MDMPDTIDTSRLRLRRLTITDAADIAAYAGDYAVASMCASIPSPYPVLAAEGWLMMHLYNQSETADQIYAICERGSDHLQGLIGINAPQTPFLGYWIARSVWGQGWATEAGAALISAYESREDILPLTAEYYLDNPASGRVLEKLGFETVGDVMLYSLARGGRFPGRQMIRTQT